MVAEHLKLLPEIIRELAERTFVTKQSQRASLELIFPLPRTFRAFREQAIPLRRTAKSLGEGF